MSSEYKIAVVGAGGLGLTASLGLLELFADKVSIVIFDFDKIELSNLNRQVYFEVDDIGKNKAETLAKRIDQSNVSSSNLKIEKSNIDTTLEQFEIILDCTDSAQTSFLLNDYCLENLKYFSYAGVIAKKGQTLFYNPNINSACLRCVFEDWTEQDYEQVENTCQAAGIIGPVAGLLGYIQAETVYQSIKNNSSKFIRYNKEEKNIKISQNKKCKCYKEIIEIDLSLKQCPQTFILSKLSLEQLSKKQKAVFKFSSQENAIKTCNSLREEKIKAISFSNNKVCACN